MHLNELTRTAIAIVTGALAVIFDTTIVSVALHDLAADLHAPLSTIQWVSTAYLLALFVTIPVAGWAQSRIGGKRLWLIALSTFLAGSVACAFAGNAATLIGFRVLQGIGGGIMLPLMSTLLMQAAHGRNLGRVMSVISLPAALGPILGPVIGGMILSSADWRWLFLINVPLGAIGLACAVRLLPAGERGRRARLDVPGMLLISPGVVAVIFGLTNVSRAGGWHRTDVLVPVVAGLALIAAFAVHAVRTPHAPLIDVQLLRHRPLTSAASLLFLTGAALYGATLLLPLFWQQVRGTDALGAGLMLIPQGVGTLLSRSLAGRLTDRIGGRYVALTGFAIVGVALLPFATATASTPRPLLLAALLVNGIGLGAVTIPLMSVAYQGLERAEVPHASIITRIAQQVGGSFGVAVSAVILQHALTTGSVAGAFDQAFRWTIGFTAAAVALSFLLPGAPEVTEPEPVLAVAK
ncbi:MDR family MFS transporter [Actinoplanes sp. N902-109]|uniref:MDR family MFS transporter n=1 Tax=Actinoplanes sp. (strain N902-109) TaxID=649831 RepID=UPI000329651B|nr:MDR family MFS transporter [Actinoplanes sp. N902-109]AGL14822.1 drug resistance transporter EmrB/QacA subfamily [Actinoplanes sp. N902-109]